MQHIPALKKPTTCFFECAELLCYLTKSFLIAIFYDTPANFGLDTTFRQKEFLNRFDRYFPSAQRVVSYADSGGYDYKCGRVPPHDAMKLIECYRSALLHMTFKYFFTLDFAYNNKYPWANTYNWIFSINKISLSSTIKTIEKNPKLFNRVYFVWHGSSSQLYQIFSQLYTKLNLKDYIHNFAIGGLVGWKNDTKSAVSPILWMSFRSFFEYLNARNFTKSFALHLLGIKDPVDRFTATLLEQLFSACLWAFGTNQNCQITYDTSAYCRQGARPPKLKIYLPHGDTLQRIPIVEVPEKIIRSVYFQDNFFKKYIHNRDLLSNNHRFESSNIFMPINTLSHMNLDDFFSKLINDFSLVNLFLDHTKFKDFKGSATEAVSAIVKTHPTVINHGQGAEILENLVAVYDFHKWAFPITGSLKELDELILQYLTKSGRA